ncbi:peptide chain release factor N(5)-glutamine methyltransferase, partial [Paracoccus sp. APAP_BH8]
MALRQGAARLAQAGVPGAAEDARLLLAHALDLPRHQLTG